MLLNNNKINKFTVGLFKLIIDFNLCFNSLMYWLIVFNQ